MKQTLNGFSKKYYKTIKFTDVSQLKEEMFINFYYGPYDPYDKKSKQYFKPLIGKIKTILDNGVTVYVNSKAASGWFNPSFDRINKIFVKKTSGRLLEEKIKCAEGACVTGILDATISRIIDMVKEIIPKYNIEDEKKNTIYQYSRETKFIPINKKHKQIVLYIPDTNTNAITVLGFSRKTSLKVKNNKISMGHIKKIAAFIIKNN